MTVASYDVKNRADRLDFFFRCIKESALAEDLLGLESGIVMLHGFLTECAVRGLYSVIEPVPNYVTELMSEIDSGPVIQMLGEHFPIALASVYDIFRLHDCNDLRKVLIENIVKHQAVAFDPKDAGNSRAVSLCKLMIKQHETILLPAMLDEILKFNPDAIPALINHGLRSLGSELHQWVIDHQDEVLPLLSRDAQVQPLSYRILIDLKASGCDLDFASFPSIQAIGTDLIYRRHKLGEVITFTPDAFDDPQEFSLNAMVSYSMVHDLHHAKILTLAANLKFHNDCFPAMDAIIAAIDKGFVIEHPTLRERMGEMFNIFLDHYPERITAKAIERFDRNWFTESSIFMTHSLEVDLGL